MRVFWGFCAFLFGIIFFYQCTKEKLIVLSDEKEIMSFSLQEAVVATQWERQTLYLVTELTVIGEKGTVRLSGTNLNRVDFWDVENMEKPDMDFPPIRKGTRYNV